MCKNKGLIMSNSDDGSYKNQLEQLIVTKLLPEYLQHCKTTGRTADLTDVPRHIVKQFEHNAKIPKLFQPF
jgi:hypothetical protein